MNLKHLEMKTEINKKIKAKARVLRLVDNIYLSSSASSSMSSDMMLCISNCLQPLTYHILLTVVTLVSPLQLITAPRR